MFFVNCDFNLTYFVILLCYINCNFTFAKHPVLYFNLNDLSSLRHKAKTTHAKIAKIIEEAGKSLKENPKSYLPPESFEAFGSRWNEIYGNNLCAFAMYCVLFPKDTRALELVTTFMDRMTSYPDWYVKDSRNKDEVPIGHSLTGFATAFDFLYEKFTDESREKYLDKIKVETEHMHNLIEKKRMGWTKQHIHNHAPTNILATLLGTMVYEVHFPEVAKPWKKSCIDLLEKAMLLFSYVIDGTCDEGVAYGSYTSRGITQYVYLAKRHFNIDHTKNPWLKQHFNFFFATTMPGYQRTVGIADSNHNWFYGPESQLVFLDAYVMRNGYGNWLADKIRSAKPKNPPLARSQSQKWSTVHTEFIFYDASLKSVPPVLPSNSSLHIFSDWGVVTYGGGQSLKKGNTFLSFKSAALNGEAISDIVNHQLLSDFIKGWENFNAGHEHPDQNSFVFAPNGRYFITEEHYAEKQSYLNNVLTFSPSDFNCNQPWEGQVGECNKWLRYKEKLPVPRGKITTATSTNGFVYIAGEAVNAYRPELGLKSVQRSLLLLHPEVLLVLDTIVLHPDSFINRASAYFHNILHPFHPYRHAGYQGAQVIYPEGPYAFFWFQPNGKSPSAQLHNQPNEARFKKGVTNYVNIVFPVSKTEPTRIAYAFVGPNVRISKVEFQPKSSRDVARLQIVINQVQYDVEIASSVVSLLDRTRQLGFGGFASVKTDGVITRLGIETPQPPLDRCSITDEEAANTFVKTLVSSTKLKVDPPTPVTEDPEEKPESQYGFIRILYLIVFSLFCLRVFRQRTSMKWKATLGLLLLWMLYTFIDICPECRTEELKPPCNVPDSKEIFSNYQPPTIAIVSLPHSGADLLGMIFENSTDFLYLSSTDLSVPNVADDPLSFDPCYWPQLNQFSAPAGWFSTISSEPLLFLNNHPSNPNIERVRRKFREKGKSGRFVLNLNTGFWNSKLPWLQSAIGSSFRAIVVVRDPRAWIYSLMRSQRSSKLAMEQKSIRYGFISNFVCHSPAVMPYEFRSFKGKTSVERLAEVWSSSVATMIRNGRKMQIVRFEDLLVNPDFAAQSIMQRLGTTLAVPEINRLKRAVRSGHFALPYEPQNVLSPTSINSWKVKLPHNHVVAIERICGKMMKMLGYV